MLNSHTASRHRQVFPFLLMLLSSAALQAQIPPEVEQQLQARYPDATVLCLEDLPADDREIWKRSYGDRSPGFVRGHFSPRDTAGLMVTLTRRGTARLSQCVVLVERRGTPDSNAVTVIRAWENVSGPSVLRKEKPGVFTSADGERKVRTKYDSGIYEKLEAGALLLYWTKHGFRSLVISD